MRRRSIPPSIHFNSNVASFRIIMTETTSPPSSHEQEGQAHGSNSSALQLVEYEAPDQWLQLFADSANPELAATEPTPLAEAPEITPDGTFTTEQDDGWHDLVAWSPLRLSPLPGPSLLNERPTQAPSAASSSDPLFPPESQSDFSDKWDKIPEFQLGLQTDESSLYLVNQVSPSSSQSPNSSDKAPSNSGGAGSSKLPVKKTVSMKKRGESSQAKRKRRGFLETELQKINAVRQESACIRCQILKEPCGEGCPCPRCLDVRATATVWRSPCFKGRISDVLVYRNRCMSFPEGLRSIHQWASPRKLKIQLYHIGFSGVVQPPESRPKLEIVVQNFVPDPTDVLHKQWVRDGQIIRYDMPAYAIPPKQKKAASRAVEQCFKHHWDTLVNEYTVDQDELISAALQEAKRLHKDSTLIHSALSICAVTRLISRSFNLTGQETLGINAVDDPVSPYYGRIPIPMFLDTQLDELWESLMGKISKKLLSELKRKIMARKKEDWHQVCLCLIILLANLELVYSAWLGQKHRYYHMVT